MADRRLAVGVVTSEDLAENKCSGCFDLMRLALLLVGKLGTSQLVGLVFRAVSRFKYCLYF